MWCAIRSSAVSWKPMRGRMLEVATSVGPGWPDDPDWEVLAIGAAHAAVSHTPFGGLIEAPFDAEISIRLTDDAEVRKLNHRSEEHTSELQSLMRISYAVFCLKTKIQLTTNDTKHSPHYSST